MYLSMVYDRAKNQPRLAWRRPNSGINKPSNPPPNGEKYRTLETQNDCSYDMQQAMANNVPNFQGIKM